MIDLSRDPVKQLTMILSELERARLLVKKPKGKVEIERKYAGASLRIIQTEDLRMLNARNWRVAQKLPHHRCYSQNIGRRYFRRDWRFHFRKHYLQTSRNSSNKIDVKGAQANLNRLEKYVGQANPHYPSLNPKKSRARKLGETLFKTLSILRVYTKEPGQELRLKPISKERFHFSRPREKHTQRLPRKLWLRKSMGQTVSFQPAESRFKLHSAEMETLWKFT